MGTQPQEHRRHRSFSAVGWLAIGAISFLALGSANAATITLTTADTFGNSSFSAAGNWSNASAPSAGNDYVVSINQLRTPADGNSYFFGGDSLTVAAGGKLMYKGSGTSGVLTINNLILSGGTIDHRNSFADVLHLAGSLNVTAASIIAPQQGSITIDSTITGTGGITIPATDNSNAYSLTLTAVSSYTGSMSVAGNLILASTGGLTFDIGSSGVNNSISGTGSSTFDGVFSFDLADASSVAGDSWTIVSTTTKTFSSSFAVAGFVETDNVWTSGNYQFSEITGVLSVVPEPSAAIALLGGAALLLGMRRTRRSALALF